MVETINLAKEVIIICTLIANNNYNRPTVNIDNIIRCNNILNQPLVIKKHENTNPYTESNNNSDRDNIYIIENSNVNITK